MNSEQAWQATLGELQLQMTRATFNTWLKDARFLAHEDDLFFISVPSAYAKDWLENRLCATIRGTLERIVGSALELRFVVWNDPASSRKRPAAESPLLDTPTRDGSPIRDLNGPGNGHSRGMPLTPRYTFDTFVVGAGNRLAHAAALAAVEKPARAYNPLFIYGGVGLGKTHLLHAIGHACVRNNLNVVYVSSEDFTNDLVSSIRTHKTEAFRDKYRSPDVLLLDDIQFIAGKESTQEELFHTFNTLHRSDRQLVLSSDRPPKAMAQLEERLQSRFEWGLIADIQPPDLETRLAILQSKAESLGADIPSDVLQMISYYIRSNIRELEGALNKVVAYSQLTGGRPSVQLAEMALADLVNRAADLSIDDISAAVADYYGLTVEELTGPGRTRKVARPRQLVMYLAREETDSSLPQIGKALGDRDHTTILYGCDKVEDLIETNPSLRREVLEIKARLFERAAVH
jgi:chromosomal replication initiator protein